MVELGRNTERKYLKILKSTYYRWRKEGKLVPRTGPGEDRYLLEDLKDIVKKETNMTDFDVPHTRLVIQQIICKGKQR